MNLRWLPDSIFSARPGAVRLVARSVIRGAAFGLWLIAGVPVIAAAQQSTSADSLLRRLAVLTLPDTARANLLNNLASALEYRSLDSSLRYAREALRLSDSLRYDKGQAYARLIIGYDYYQQGRYDVAMQEYVIASNLSERIGYTYIAAFSQAGIGNISMQQKKLSDALAYYLTATRQFQKLGDLDGLETMALNIGRIYQQQKKFAEATRYFEQSDSLAKILGDQSARSYALHYIGLTLDEQQQYQAALTYHLNALRLARAGGDKRYLITALITLGAAYGQQKNYAAAMRYASEGLANAETSGYAGELKESYRVLYDLNQQQGNFKAALEFYQRYTAANDSIFSDESNRRTLELQTRFETLAKEQQIAILQKSNEVQSLEGERQRNALIGGIAFAAALALLFANRYRLKRQVADALREKNDALTRLNHDLAGANQLKTELLSIAAHDLKNPLQSVMGFSELIRESEPPASAVSEMAAMIRTSSERMLAIISDLLQTAAMDSGKLNLNRSRVDLAGLVEAAVRYNRPQAAKKSQHLDLSLGAEDMSASVDAERMLEVIDNLISNAIKYTPQGKRVWVSVAQLRRTDVGLRVQEGKKLQSATGAPRAAIRISVKDEGQGLTAEDMTKIFGKFQRLSARPTAGESSTGLGLSIVKQLVELHGGSVQAESEGKNKGSTFTVDLPNA
ncbi:MAG: tetratricopeptide repeat protein [Rhizobacter sp.]|nr:tetratricopeptide repeat protein [Chlorobiales bacterium]